MSTSKGSREFGYAEHMREHGPDTEAVRRGTAARRARREATKQKITIRIDDDLLEQFKAMVPDGRGYQSVINQALREWLVAKGVKELVRQELAEVVQKALSALPIAARS